jgi:hypothetical protein|tara:strand:- start:1852 stop:2448 length:597 start_codon:yes stop_codon:yes gene_type:complete
MKIELIDIKKIKNNPNNPRIIKDHKYAKLLESIKDFPEMLKIRPIVVDDNMVVLGGNMRLKACREAGIKKIHIIKASELTDEQKKQFVIKDNVNFGEWDWDMIANEWDSTSLEYWGLDVWQNVDDVVNKVNSGDEWVGMPEFETIDNPLKITISFENEEDREEFDKVFKIKYVSKGNKTWSTWWPYKEKQDLKSLKYE